MLAARFGGTPWGRSPQGECGLKYIMAGWLAGTDKSLPARGVWIEITSFAAHMAAYSRSPQGECGLKFGSCVDGIVGFFQVAPRKGSVD